MNRECTKASSGTRLKSNSGGWHPKSDFLPLPDGIAHYVDVGDERERPVLVLLHGYVMSSWSWRLNIEALATQFRVIALCHKGFGFSEKPKDVYTLESLGDFVMDALNVLRIQEFHLIGHSMGGAIAMNLSLAHPERVKRLVLLCSAGLRWELPRALHMIPIDVMRPTARLFFRRPVMQRLLQRYGYEKPVVNRVFMDTYMRAFQAPGAAYAAMKTAREFSSGLARIHPRIHEIRTKTLVLWGGKDRILPLSIGKRIAGKLDNGRLVVFEDCGHCPNEEDAGRFNHEVLAFLME